MSHRFSFANAMLHFAQTHGPGGFIWRYMLTFLVGVVALAGLAYFLFQPLVGVVVDTALRAAQGVISGEDMELILTREVTGMVGRIVFSWILLMLLGILFWAMFEAAIQRRYVREEGFSLRLGGDELRLLVVGMIWFVFFIVGYFISLMVAGLLISLFAMIANGNEVLLQFGFMAGFLIAGLGWAYLAVRLSPASAITVRDRKIHFLHAWGASRRRFLPLFFAYALLGLALWIVSTMVYSAGAVAVITTALSSFNDIDQMEDNPADLLLFFLNGEFIAAIAATYSVLLMMQGLFLYVWAGPAALAAKTDPRGGSIAQAPDVFE